MTYRFPTLPDARRSGTGRGRWLVLWRNRNAGSHALGSPHADARRLEGKTSRPMRLFILDLVDADRILERHAVRAREIKEARAGSGVPARPEDDRHVPFA